MNILQMLKSGGVTVVILICCSVVSVTIIVERIVYYRRRSRMKRNDFMATIRSELGRGMVNNAIEFCKKTPNPFSSVVFAGLNLNGHPETVISNAMEREIAIETNKLERYTSIVGTIGSTAVYIGLFGTVLGIIRAFNDISLSGSGGINVVINGIAEALICTAAGLAVAVPAVIAFNYFVKKVDNFVSDMELCASETMDLLVVKGK